MKAFRYAVVSALMISGFAVKSFAAEEHQVSPEPEGGRISLEEIMQEGDTDGGAANPHHHRIWHCTAYPEGFGHSHGFSHFDRHYNHAYWGAMQRCEAAMHVHCHDIHCHQD